MEEKYKLLSIFRKQELLINLFLQEAGASIITEYCSMHHWKSH